jgi:hypothetical protein
VAKEISFEDERNLQGHVTLRTDSIIRVQIMSKQQATLESGEWKAWSEESNGSKAKWA